MSIITPSQLVANSNRVNAAKKLRIEKYLNAALQDIVLAPGQTRVEKLFLVKAKSDDLDMLKHLMEESGYTTVTVITRPAGYNEEDVVMSFTIPE